MARRLFTAFAIGFVGYFTFPAASPELAFRDLFSRALEGGYPTELNAAINNAFAEAVDRVSTLSSDKGRAVKLSITDGRLTLSVNNPDSGSASEELPVEYGFDPLEIGFNARYLLDISGQLEGGTAEFQLADSGSPTMVSDGKDMSALYVLMPMRDCELIAR